MNVVNGIFERAAAKKRIRCTPKLDPKCPSVAENQIQFVAIGVQMFSDKSRSSLKASWLAIFPLHLAHLNFAQEM